MQKYAIYEYQNKKRRALCPLHEIALLHVNFLDFYILFMIVAGTFRPKW